MRRIHIGKGDFALFHQDINPIDYEFFKNHTGAFKRMWNEQTRPFWVVFVDMFDHFIWKYGVMKDFPLKIDEVRLYVDEIISLITMSFVEGNASSAKCLVTDCAVVAQNRHYIGALDRASYSQNPFYIKDTRETFRKLFGMPRSKTTFMKVLCGLPVYVKFAGAIVTTLRRWLSADDIDDTYCRDDYLSQLSSIRADDKTSLEAIERTIIREKKREEQDKATKRVSKKHFAHESTKQKALEWVDSSNSSVAGDLEELDPPPKEKLSYKSEYKRAIQSVTEDVRNSLVESIAEVKRKEIELAREKGEDVEPIIEEFKANLAKRKRPRKKKRRGGGAEGDDEISSLLALHKEVSSSDKYLEAIGLKDPTSPVLLTPCITEVSDEDSFGEEKPFEEKEQFGQEKTVGKEKPSEEEKLFEEEEKIFGNKEEPFGKEKELEVAAANGVKGEECNDGDIKLSCSVITDDQKSDIPVNGTTGEQQNDPVDPVVTGEKESVVEPVVPIVTGEKESVEEPLVTENPVVPLVTGESVVTEEKESVLESTSVQVEDSTAAAPATTAVKVEQNHEEVLSQTEEQLPNTSAVKSSSPVNSEDLGKRRLHVCSYCQKKEELAKSFKRCVKCRGKPNPRYYCSKTCQVNDWKAGHRLDHKDIAD